MPSKYEYDEAKLLIIKAMLDDNICPICGQKLIRYNPESNPKYKCKKCEYSFNINLEHRIKDVYMFTPNVKEGEPGISFYCRNKSEENDAEENY